MEVPQATKRVSRPSGRVTNPDNAAEHDIRTHQQAQQREARPSASATSPGTDAQTCKKKRAAGNAFGKETEPGSNSASSTVGDGQADEVGNGEQGEHRMHQSDLGRPG